MWVIPPAGASEEYSNRIEMDDADSWQVDQATIDAVRGGVKRIYVMGLIEFRDVIDTHWSLKFFGLWWSTWLDARWQYTT
jgi:hypothetical protein